MDFVGCLIRRHMKTKELKIRKGPFRGRRWSEITTTELIAVIKTYENRVLADKCDEDEEAMLFDLQDRLNGRQRSPTYK
jgi:hypothetical protein